MKVAGDTNILAYAEGVNGAAMRDRALELIQRLPPAAIVLPVQALGDPCLLTANRTYGMLFL